MSNEPLSVQLEELTVKAIACLRRASDAHRDSAIECGGYCYEIVKHASESGERRYSYGARIALANRLSAEVGHKVNVYMLITYNRIATLLGEGRSLGKLGLHALRLFYPFIRRKVVPNKPTKNGKRQKLRLRIPTVRSEEYELVPERADIGKQLFAQAVAENWTANKVKEMVAQATGVTYQEKGRYKTEYMRGYDHCGDARGSNFDLEQLAKRSTPRDFAEYLSRLINLNEDPAAVLRYLPSSVGLEMV